MLPDQNKFIFVAPFFNASKTVHRMLSSVAVQSHTNWRVILIDDVSNYEESAKLAQIVQDFNVICQRNEIGSFSDGLPITLIKNTEKKWEVENVLRGIHMCEDNDIICRIDADDYLVDSDALTIIDSAYRESGCDVLWTMHRWGMSDRNISAALPSGVDPYKYQWVSSHLKTWRKYLSNDIADENYKNQDGVYVRRAGDQAVYLPVLYKAKKRAFLPRALYHYNIEENGGAVYQTDDAKFQRDEAVFLRERGFVK